MIDLPQLDSPTNDSVWPTNVEVDVVDGVNGGAALAKGAKADNEMFDEVIDLDQGLGSYHVAYIIWR